MGNWFRRFLAMSDRQRARLLAEILAVFILAVLYGLGGLSYYLRVHYLQPTPTRGVFPTSSVAEATAPSTVNISEPPPPSATPTLVEPTPSPTPPIPVLPTLTFPTPSLYPTITPSHSGP